MAAKDTTLTPLALIAALGEFDLDPCAVQGHSTAKRLVILPTDGLIEAWEGRVWLNPPYSNPGPWVDRMAAHGNGVALLLASTDTAWFQRMAKTAEHYLFLSGRPRFLRLDRSEVELMRATVLVGWGDAGRRLASRPLPGTYLPGVQPIQIAA